MRKYEREMANRLFMGHDKLKPKRKHRRLSWNAYVETLVADGVRRVTAQRIANEICGTWHLIVGERLRISIKR